MGTYTRIYVERRGQDGDMEMIYDSLTTEMEDKMHYATYAMLSNVRNTYSIYTPFVTHTMDTINRTAEQQKEKEIELGIGTGFPCYDDYIKYRYIQYDISMELAECASKYDDYNLRGFILLDDLINFDYNAEVLFDGATEEQIDGFDCTYGLYAKWIDIVPSNFLTWLKSLKAKNVTRLYFTYG